MVGFRTALLLFNTPFSFSLHVSSKTLATCFESAKAGGIVRFSDSSSMSDFCVYISTLLFSFSILVIGGH